MKNSNVTFRQLRAFVELADMRSFTRAAARLGLTQSGLSILIKELEKELEVQLFDRHPRLVDTTSAGLELYPLARRALNSLNEAVDSMSDLRHLKRGRVRLGVTQMLACTHIPMAVAHFQQIYPNVEVLLLDGLLSQHLANIAAGEIELAIGPDMPATEAVRSNLLFRSEVMVVCAPNHPLATRANPRWRDLREHRLIAPSADYIPSLSADIGPKVPGGLKFNDVQTVDYMTTAIGMASAGLGFTICPEFSAPFVKGYGLQMLRLRDPAYQRNIYIYGSEQRSASHAVSSFVDTLQQYFQTISPSQ